VVTNDSFNWGRQIPTPVLILDSGQPLVGISPCYQELTERHYDHANNVNKRAFKTAFIGDAYATALMGGEPYSSWN
jgi:hypothetical protein